MRGLRPHVGGLGLRRLRFDLTVASMNLVVAFQVEVETTIDDLNTQKLKHRAHSTQRAQSDSTP